MTRVLESTFQWILSFLGIRKSRVSHHLDEVITVIEPAFDREWYVAQDPEISRSGLDPVAHYVLLGAERGLDPHPGFSTSRYLQRREDVRTSGMNPYYHWLRFGQSEGREDSGTGSDTGMEHPLRNLRGNAMFSVVLCGAGRTRDQLARSIDSLAQQSYRNFEVIVLGDDDAGRTHNFLLSSRGMFCEPRMSPADILCPGGEQCWRGDYLMLLAWGDTLEIHALDSLSQAAAPGDEETEILVCDYIAGPHDTRRKIPGLDLALLKECDYLLSACAVSRSAALRVTSAAVHDCLYPLVLSVAESGTTWRHVAEPLLRTVAAPAPAPFKIAQDDIAGGLSIIIPNRNRPDLLGNCTQFLRGLSMPLQLIIVDNGSHDPETEILYDQLRTAFGAEILHVDHEFNYSRMINAGAAAATCDYLLLLNNDVMIADASAVAVAVNYASRPDVGIVGSVMWYPTGDLQHAGLVFWVDHGGGLGSDHILRHAVKSDEENDPLSPLATPREWQAVTGAFQVVRRQVYEMAGGYDECNLPIEYNDVDFCFRVRAMGMKVVCLPLPGIIHDESSTRRDIEPNTTRRMRQTAHLVMKSRWHSNFLFDPYFHPEARSAMGVSSLRDRLRRRPARTAPAKEQAGRRSAWQQGVYGEAWSPRHLRPGASILGFLNSEIGLGEAARNLGRACDAARLPTSYVNRLLPKRANEPVIESFFQQRADRRATIRVEGLTLDGYDMNDEGVGRLQVFYPYWELPRIPEGARAMLDRYDEIWAGSDFIASALREATRKTVRLIPQPLNLSAASPQVRPRSDTLRFLTFFDFDSYIARKNPLAAIAAFRAAFPRRRDVELVVKARGLTNDHGRRMVSAAIGGDSRIRLIDETLSRSQMSALMSEADAFVSLHRAEGFGFGAAEALAAGKAVIATNWSATSEFVTPETGFVVDYKLRPVGSTEYIYADGQVWAEPIVDSAVAQFQAIADDPEAAWEKARKGHDLLFRNNSFASVGARIAAALDELGAL